MISMTMTQVTQVTMIIFDLDVERVNRSAFEHPGVQRCMEDAQCIQRDVVSFVCNVFSM